MRQIAYRIKQPEHLDSVKIESINTMQMFNKQYNTSTISHSFTDSPFVTVQLLINNKNYLNWNDALTTQLSIPGLHAFMPK